MESKAPSEWAEETKRAREWVMAEYAISRAKPRSEWTEHDHTIITLGMYYERREIATEQPYK
jgi:hypothetical protein